MIDTAECGRGRTARGLSLGTLIAALTLGGCAAATSPSPSSPSATPAMNISVSNGTTLTVTLTVNGTPVATSTPGSPTEVVASALPPLPWAVAATTASGRVLTTMTVTVEDATQTDPSVHVIPMGRVDLSCGRLTIWAGGYPPSGPIPASPAGRPGDCEP